MPAQQLESGNAIGPHPGIVALPMRFLSQEKIDHLLFSRCADEQERSIVEAKEDSLRLKGVAWIDNVRRAMQMPVNTYTTACVYYHKFRLSHPPGTKIGDSYFLNDAAAASLLVACKSEETKKYSRDILAAVHNLKFSNPHEHVMADDPIFEDHSRTVIELERLILETIKFNFRDHNPHELLVKLARRVDSSEAGMQLCAKAFAILTELYRTFAPLKHTAVTLCYASLELAAHLLYDAEAAEKIRSTKLHRGTPERASVMEVLLDALDHYARHTNMSILGQRYSLDKFLQVRLVYNRECETQTIPRYAKPMPTPDTTQMQNGHPTPVSPADRPVPQDLNELLTGNTRFNRMTDSNGTMRFAMNPDDAIAETDAITKYLKDEYEEIEEEIEIREPPRQPRGASNTSPSQHGNSSQDRRDPNRHWGRGPPDRGPRPYDRRGPSGRYDDSSRRKW